MGLTSINPPREHPADDEVAYALRSRRRVGAEWGKTWRRKINEEITDMSEFFIISCDWRGEVRVGEGWKRFEGETYRHSDMELVCECFRLAGGV